MAAIRRRYFGTLKSMPCKIEITLCIVFFTRDLFKNPTQLFINSIKAINVFNYSLRCIGWQKWCKGEQDKTTPSPDIIPWYGPVGDILEGINKWYNWNDVWVMKRTNAYPISWKNRERGNKYEDSGSRRGMYGVEWPLDLNIDNVLHDICRPTFRQIFARQKQDFSCLLFRFLFLYIFPRFTKVSFRLDSDAEKNKEGGDVLQEGEHSTDGASI